MTSHTAQLRQPKLPGISSRFLLETNFDAQPLKGRLIFGALAVSLKRYPDTNPAALRRCPCTNPAALKRYKSIIAKAVLWKLDTGYWVLGTGLPKAVL